MLAGVASALAVGCLTMVQATATACTGWGADLRFLTTAARPHDSNEARPHGRAVRGPTYFRQSGSTRQGSARPGAILDADHLCGRAAGARAPRVGRFAKPFFRLSRDRRAGLSLDGPGSAQWHLAGRSAVLLGAVLSHVSRRALCPRRAIVPGAQAGAGGDRGADLCAGLSRGRAGFSSIWGCLDCRGIHGYQRHADLLRRATAFGFAGRVFATAGGGIAARRARSDRGWRSGGRRES
jgi:hypothetical protein